MVALRVAAKKVDAMVALIAPQSYENCVVEGTGFSISEGAKLIATGFVTRVLHLRENALEMRNKENG